MTRWTCFTLLFFAVILLSCCITYAANGEKDQEKHKTVLAQGAETSCDLIVYIDNDVGNFKSHIINSDVTNDQARTVKPIQNACLYVSRGTRKGAVFRRVWSMTVIGLVVNSMMKSTHKHFQSL